MMFQSALLASKSSEEKGNMSSRPCKKGKSGWIYSVTSTSCGVIKPKESDGNFKTKEKRNINNLPCDISEARFGSSERMFAIRTPAVTQEFATYTRNFLSSGS